MKNNFSTAVVVLLLALVIALITSSNAVAFGFIYCESPAGKVRAISTSYASDCKGFATSGSWQIDETRANELFEQERLRALGLDNEQLLETQGDSDIEPGGQQGSGTDASQ